MDIRLQNELQNKRGGIASWDQVDSGAENTYGARAKQYLDGLTLELPQRFYKKAPRSLNYGLFDSKKISAFSFSSGSPGDGLGLEDSIWLSVGALRWTHIAMEIAMLCPKVFPDIGKPWSEEAYLEWLPKALRGEVLFPDIVPCEVRHHYALLLALTAVRFLFLHEFRHLQLGHLDFLREEVELAAKETMWVQQAMEFHADAGAFSMLWAEMVDIRNDAMARYGADWGTDSGNLAFRAAYGGALEMYRQRCSGVACCYVSVETRLGHCPPKLEAT